MAETATEQLTALCEQLELRFEAVGGKDNPARGYRVLRMQCPGETVEVPVYDEFDDVTSGGTVMHLQLVLSELEGLEESEDFDEWRRDAELANVPDQDAHKVHDLLSAAAPRVRAIVGESIQAMSLHEFEFNTSKAQALRSARTQAELVDRYCGVLLGTAVGDSLGLPYEGLSRQRVNRFAQLPLQQRFLLGHGMLSDDTEHTLFVAQALLEHAQDSRAFARRLARSIKWWFLSLPAGIGLGTARACIKLCLGRSHEHSGVGSAGNGAAMRVGAIGALFLDDAQRRSEFTELATRVTHTDPRARVGALAIANAIAWSIAHNRTRRIALVEFERLLSGAGFECDEWKQRGSLLIQAAEQDLSVAQFAERCGQAHGVSGYVYDTVPVCLYAWYHHFGDFERAVEATILCGGDADTTAAIVGALAGATVGVKGIPRRWLDDIRDIPRNAQLLDEVATRLAQLKRTGSSAGHVRYPTLLCLPRNMVFLATVLAHGMRRLLPPY